MIEITNPEKTCFETIQVDEYWNTGEGSELKVHRVHSYPAKFPAFITTKALQYARQNGLNPKHIADIFCGCGTVAVEAKRNNINFWGCDINPVATMIAKAKTHGYKQNRVLTYYEKVLNTYREDQKDSNVYENANERLKYWYEKHQYEDLYHLKKAIEKSIPEKSYYRLFFINGFSNILKPTSRWLTKSIKPQIDPKKKPADVIKKFDEQIRFMLKANAENVETKKSCTEIVTKNFLKDSANQISVDMIVTSPPYVTSYEYADLHQLSSLWLNYAKDYKTLRNGSIGSLQHSYNFEREVKRLNNTGMSVVFSLIDRDKAKAKSVAKYFLDMQQVTDKCHKMLNKKGMVLFVIGDTEYKGVRIENAKHLCESLRISGFKTIGATKRKITNKILTPYRDNEGRFTANQSGRKIYSEEFIVVAKKQ